MKKTTWVILFFGYSVLSGCGFKEREDAIKQKETVLAEKEQQLLLWEKSLQLKEDSINLLMARRDSSSFADSIALMPVNLKGEWSAKMICTQTTCQGSAIGDIQTDTWQISTQDTAVVIKSVSKSNVSRVYTGNYFKGNTIKVTIPVENPTQPGSTTRLVEITEIRDKKMKGTRTVTQPDGCQVIYSLELDKKQ